MNVSSKTTTVTFNGVDQMETQTYIYILYRGGGNETVVHTRVFYQHPITGAE